MPPRRRVKRKRDELLSRFFTVSATDERLGVHGTQRKGLPPAIESHSYLEVRGSLDEPLGDTSALRILLIPTERTDVGPVRPVPVGSMDVSRSEMHGAVKVAQREFDRLWAMSLAGRLKHGHMAFTKPHYRSSFIVSISFSHEKEE